MDFTKIKQFPAQVSGVFKRFPVAMVFITLATLYYIGLVQFSFLYNELLDEHAHLVLWLAFYPTLGAVLSVGIKLFQETRDHAHNVQSRTRTLLANALPQVALAIITAYVLKDAGGPTSHEDVLIARATVLVVTTIALMFIIPSFRQKNDIPLWSLLGSALKSTLVAALIALLFYGILSALMLSLDLLFNSHIYGDKIYLYAAIISATFIFPTLFLAGLPQMTSTDERPILGKFAYGTIHYLFIPFFILFIAIIYALSIKHSIIIGEVVAAIAFPALSAITGVIVICALIYPSRFQENKLDSAVLKYTPWATLPLLLISCTHILFNLSEYDYIYDTFPLATSILHFWMLGALIILIVKKIQKKIWWTMVSLCATAIVATMFGINIFNFHLFINPDYATERDMREMQQLMDEMERTSNGDFKEAVPDTVTDIEIREDYQAKNTPVDLPTKRGSVIFLDYHRIDDSLFTIKNDTIYIVLDLSETAKSSPDSAKVGIKEQFTLPVSSLVDTANHDDASTSRRATVNHPVVLANEGATLVIKQGQFYHSTARESSNSAYVSGALFLK